MGHAITPTATRGLPTTEGPAYGVHDAGRLQALALAIADSAARSDIELYCIPVVVDHAEWYDTQQVRTAVHISDRDFIDTALEYLAQRAAAGGAGFRCLKHTVYPHLVRFEAIA